MGFIAPIAAAVGSIFGPAAAVGTGIAGAAGLADASIGAITGISTASVAAGAASAISPLAIAGLGLSAVSGIAGAAGNIESSQAQATAAKYNAQVAQENSQEEIQNATLTEQEGSAQAGIQSLQTRATLGAIEANQAASGIDVNSGSDLDVRSSARQLGELDALTVRTNATKQAYGQEVQSVNDTAQGQLDIQEASADETSGLIGAGTTLLGAAGSAASNFAKWQLNSGFSF